MDNEKLENILNDNKYDHVFHSSIMLSCQYLTRMNLLKKI